MNANTIHDVNCVDNIIFQIRKSIPIINLLLGLLGHNTHN